MSPAINRVFSGVQPTGNLHRQLSRGNPQIRGASGKPIAFYCVVDMHAVTVWQDPGRAGAQYPRSYGCLHRVRHRSSKHIVFNQSQVGEHAELAWMFNCVARMGWLNRMTQFKEKAGKDQSENASVGLFSYPALMAADILLYRATHVPVGDDQKQHLRFDATLRRNSTMTFRRRLQVLAMASSISR
ncbi:MAG: hypothetical protein R3D34_05010 [Nitratireductor sp.]